MRRKKAGPTAPATTDLDTLPPGVQVGALLADPAAAPAKIDLSFTPLSLPKFKDPRFAYYAVRCAGRDRGWTPAKPTEGFQTQLANPTPGLTSMYPPRIPGQRHPERDYEFPKRNAICMARLDTGVMEPMYTVDAQADGLAHTDPLTVERRVWVAMHDGNLRYFEDPRAAAANNRPCVTELTGWCPLLDGDELDNLGQHGVVYGVGQLNPFTGLESAGECERCAADEDKKRRALAKIADHMKRGV